MTDNHPENAPGSAPESTLDARGLLCPLPVLRARKALMALPPGAILTVRATDPMSVIDMPHFCREQGHQMLSSTTVASEFHFRIRRNDT